MISKRGFVLAAVVTATALAGAAAVASSGPSIADFTLKNGLELVVIPDHRAPVVTHMIWYKVGAADERPGKSGIAHFLEHLMFKGTAKHPAGQFSTVVAKMGGQENAFTSDDYTGFYQRVPSGDLEKVMSFEADRMTGLVLTDAVVLPERQVILEERNQRIDNNPRAKLGVQIDAALYLNSPYGKPTIGWRSEMEHLTRDDAIAFYHRFYAPNNAVVVIAGDVKPEEALKFAQETYGKINPNPNITPRNWPKEPPPVAARTVTLADARVEQPLIQRAYLAPSFATAKRSEFGSVGSARAHSRRRLKQPALQGPCGQQDARGQRWRLVRQHGARHDEVRRLRRAAAGRLAAAARKGDRRGDRPRGRQGRDRRGA